MSNSYELIDRILKHEPVHKFLILDKKGTRINPDRKEEDVKRQDNFNTEYSNIPKLVDKATSIVRNINPLNELSFVQISYAGYEYLIAPDQDLYVFTAVKCPNKN